MKLNYIFKYVEDKESKIFKIFRTKYKNEHKVKRTLLNMWLIFLIENICNILVVKYIVLYMKLI